MKNLQQILRVALHNQGRPTADCFQAAPQHHAQPTTCGSTSNWLDASESRIEKVILAEPAGVPQLPYLDSAKNGGIRAPRDTSNWIDYRAELETSRKISNVRQSKVIGADYSHTGAGMLPTESTLESSASLLLDWAAGVTELRSQPDPIEYQLFGKTRKTTPDFSSTINESRYVIEVKPLKKAARPILEAKFRAAALAAAAQQRHYCVITERLICREPRLQNISAMRSFAMYPLRSAEVDRLSALIPSDTFGITLARLKELVARDWELMKPVLGSMIYWHRIQIAWDEPLCGETVLRMRGVFA